MLGEVLTITVRIIIKQEGAALVGGGAYLSTAFNDT